MEQNRPRRVEFVPDPVAWTEVPDTLRQLARQRDRWHRGLAETVWRNPDIIGRRRYGPFGLFVLVMGVTVGALDVTFAVLPFLGTYGIAVLLSLLALLFDELVRGLRLRPRDRIRLFIAVLIENLGYRQLTVFWRIRGLWRWSRGRSDCERVLQGVAEVIV